MPFDDGERDELLETARRIEHKRTVRDLRLSLFTSLLTVALLAVLGIAGFVKLESLIEKVERATIENRIADARQSRELNRQADSLGKLVMDIEGRLVEKEEVRQLRREIRRMRLAVRALNAQIARGLVVRFEREGAARPSGGG